jgi:hypothetical protein
MAGKRKRPKKKIRLVEVHNGWVHTCRECGGEFEAKRSDARYCSDACRARAHYVRTKR